LRIPRKVCGRHAESASLTDHRLAQPAAVARHLEVVMSRCVAMMLFSISLLAATRDGLAQAPPWIATWGSYGSGGGQFLTPVGVAVDQAGNLYVADSNNNSIQKFSSTGIYLSQWS